MEGLSVQRRNNHHSSYFIRACPRQKTSRQTERQTRQSSLPSPDLPYNGAIGASEDTERRKIPDRSGRRSPGKQNQQQSVPLSSCLFCTQKLHSLKSNERKPRSVLPCLLAEERQEQRACDQKSKHKKAQRHGGCIAHVWVSACSHQ